MDIRPVVLQAGAPSAQTHQPTRLPAQATANAAAAEAVQAALPMAVEAEVSKPVEGPRVTKVRAELMFDESIKRVVGRIFDQETGQTLYEIPPEGIRQLYAKTREQLAALLDKTA